LNTVAKAAAPTIRPDFDANSFLREAKSIFLKVQTRSEAEVAGDWKLHLAPSLLAELEAQGRAPRVDAVEKLEAEFLGVEADDCQQLASVRFSGLVGDGAGPVPMAQVWDFSRPRPAGRWVVTEIETIDAVAATAVKTSQGQTVHRLAPRTSPRHQAWASLAIGLLVGAVGSLLLRDAFGQEFQSPWDLLDGNLWLEFLVGAAFCLTGALALWRAILAFLSLGRPETIVEVTPLRFARGSTVSITFRQPGPMSLKSLRASLVGIETWREANDKGSRDLGAHELLNSSPQEILADRPYETTVKLRVPRNLYPSGPTAKGHQVEWAIEVYGKVGGGVDFAHSYVVQIC
jgi:hypothetical protein